MVVVRAALTAFDVALEQRRAGSRAAWRVADAPADAVVAFNAGQFAEAGPWGWLVLEARTLQAPGTGSLTPALAFADTLAWIDAPLIEAAARRRWRFAFQSCPVLDDAPGGWVRFRRATSWSSRSTAAAPGACWA